MLKLRYLPSLAATAAAALVMFASQPATANIIIDPSQISILAQGFGNVPRLITVQGAAAPPSETACDANSGGGPATGARGFLGTDAATGGTGHPDATSGNDGHAPRPH